MQRIPAHQISTKSTDAIRSLINADGRGLFRELSEKDYGIDAVVELFDEGNVTGKLGLIQCKGKEDSIKPLGKDPNYISCGKVTYSNLQYLKQRNNAVILVYASLKERDNFYYVDLNEAFSESDLVKILEETGKTKTVRIPVINNAKENLDGFFALINNYYET